MNKTEMMRKVQMLNFILIDVGLFLNTHPTDKAALSFFNKYNALYRSAKNEYEQTYGPLTIYGTNDTNSWSWIDEPWPWQMEV